jgi:hypothetical protein
MGFTCSYGVSAEGWWHIITLPSDVKEVYFAIILIRKRRMHKLVTNTG